MARCQLYPRVANWWQGRAQRVFQCRLSFWTVAVFIFILDRLTKLLVVNYLPVGSSINFSFFSITHILNTGTFFGLGKSAGFLLLFFSIVVSFYLIGWHKKYPVHLQPLLGLVLGGALGNVTDRLIYGAVVDFIDFHFWPVFNVADSAISLAVVLILLFETRRRK